MAIVGESVPIQSCSPGYQGSNLAATARQWVLCCPHRSPHKAGPALPTTDGWQGGIISAARGPAGPAARIASIYRIARACMHAPRAARALLYSCIFKKKNSCSPPWAAKSLLISHFITPKPSYSRPRARGGYLLHPDNLHVT
jgi:hypothetical protein